VVPVDVRVLAATHRDLDAAIREREFREDLFYRLSVATIRLAPLRERPDDIPDLVRFFIQRYAAELGVENPSIQPEAIAWLQTQPWPGNVRELENAVRQALLQARPLAITVDHVRQLARPDRTAGAAASQTHAAYVGRVARPRAARRGNQRLLEDGGGSGGGALRPGHPPGAGQPGQSGRAGWVSPVWKMREKLTELGLRSTPDGERRTTDSCEALETRQEGASCKAAARWNAPRPLGDATEQLHFEAWNGAIRQRN